MFIERGQNLTNVNFVELPLAFGQIRHNRLWYLGYADFLQELETGLKEAKDLQVLNSPAAIQLMFHKLNCQQCLQAANIPIPTNLGAVHNFDHLLTLMDKHQINSVFVKPFHNSSASGILAFRRKKHRTNPSGKTRYSLTTSVELVREEGEIRLFNSLKMRHYTKVDDLADIVNMLAVEGLYVEKWLPKASLTGGVFDFRIVVIAGEARHIVARQSKSPITNLHLGNARGDLESIKAKIKANDWNRMLRTAENAVKAIGGATYAGVDVLLTNNWQQSYILEVNAFGDLLPRLTHRGENTYEAIVSAALDIASKA